jgi:dipeptidyl aminopeptidase/acylaminoacyl peptidase
VLRTIIRFALRQTPDGGSEILQAAAPDPWETFAKAGLEDAMATFPAGLDETGRTLYMTDSRGRDTAALFAWNLGSGRRELLAEDARADVGELLRHPAKKTVQAASFEYERLAWRVLDTDIAPDFEYLRTVADGDFRVVSRTLDDSTWIVAYTMDAGPARYYRYDREARKAEFLFTNRPALESAPLAKMRPVPPPAGGPAGARRARRRISAVSPSTGIRAGWFLTGKATGPRPG